MINKVKLEIGDLLYTERAALLTIGKTEVAHLTYEKDNSNKFWEIEVQENVLVTRYGAIGSIARTSKNILSSPTAAKTKRDSLIRGKIRRGYRAGIDNASTSYIFKDSKSQQRIFINEKNIKRNLENGKWTLQKVSDLD